MKSTKHTSGKAKVLALILAAMVESGCGSSTITSSPGFSSASGGSACFPGQTDMTTDAGCPGVGFARAGEAQPSFGSTVIAATAPPPISGGTLLVTHDGNTAIVSDPDRDAIYVVDVTGQSVRFRVSLHPGDEPGRISEDGAGRVHVALRSGGALLTLDPATGSVLTRRAVCPAPRGVAWDASSDLVWVACATGELIAFPSRDGPATRSLVVERDLRDVIVQADGAMTVTKFRSAEVLRLDGQGSVSRRDILTRSSPIAAARVAWRTIPGPSAGATLTVYQQESTLPIMTNVTGGYGTGSGSGAGTSSGGSGPFGSNSSSGTVPEGRPVALPPPLEPPGLDSIVQSAVAVLDRDGTVLSTTTIPHGVLPVDIAASADGRVAIALAGNGFTSLPSITLLSLGATSNIRLESQVPNSQQVIAVAFDGNGDLLAQARDPAMLFVIAKGAMTRSPTSISLSSVSRRDTGHDIFHTEAGGLIACASCHPEGGDDGHVWMLDGLPRRTPSLRGTIAGTAPYHWPGDEMDMAMLIDEVYTRRMSGTRLSPPQQNALAGWIQNIPAPPPPGWVDSNAAHRGQALFEGSAGCATCHSGPKFTNNQTVGVGTGTDIGREPDGGPSPTAFQVPSLVGVGWRTPLFHDGCAATIAERFGKCATPGHGSTAQLPSQDIADLTAYLDSL
ncbi:MAG: c-type cytochrome [Myxococcota bacterium]|nr:c-type cytochrome [Myxococcota bacterium]